MSDVKKIRRVDYLKDLVRAFKLANPGVKFHVVLNQSAFAEIADEDIVELSVQFKTILGYDYSVAYERARGAPAISVVAVETITALCDELVDEMAKTGGQLIQKRFRERK